MTLNPRRKRVQVDTVWDSDEISIGTRPQPKKKIVPRYGTSMVHGTQKNFNRHSASIEKSCGYRIATTMVHGTRHLKIIFTQNIFISYFRTIVFEEFSLDT